MTLRNTQMLEWVFGESWFNDHLFILLKLSKKKKKQFYGYF